VDQQRRRALPQAPPELAGGQGEKLAVRRQQRAPPEPGDQRGGFGEEQARLCRGDGGAGRGHGGNLDRMRVRTKGESRSLLRIVTPLAKYLARQGASTQVSIFDAKNQLSALVAEAERGREVTITRRGVAVAKLVPVSPGFDRDKARRTTEALRRASRGLTLGGVGIKDLVDEGRD
jgi:prevent-host-death family protein